MSTVNATTIYADLISGNNISVGNASSNQSLNSVFPNSSYVAIGANVIINSTAIAVGDASYKTVINSTAFSANNITVNGTTLTSVPTSNYQSFTSTGWSTWTKPAWASANDLVTIMMWGGGGGGNTSASGRAGGGGACVIVNKLAGECNATCNVYVASGGAPAVVGQTSVFWTNTTFSISAYGGGPSGGTTSGTGGGGGGWFSAGGGVS